MLGHSLCVKFQFCEARFGDDFAARARQGDEINNLWNRGMRLDSNKPHSLRALRAFDLLRSVLGDEDGDLHIKPFSASTVGLRAPRGNEAAGILEIVAPIE
jgi:hypothetical protein